VADDFGVVVHRLHRPVIDGHLEPVKDVFLMTPKKRAKKAIAGQG